MRHSKSLIFILSKLQLLEKVQSSMMLRSVDGKPTKDLVSEATALPIEPPPLPLQFSAFGSILFGIIKLERTIIKLFLFQVGFTLSQILV